MSQPDQRQDGGGDLDHHRDPDQDLYALPPEAVREPPHSLGRAIRQIGPGLILAASLVLLHKARNGRDAPRLARFMLWLGIAATVGVNIAYGAGHGLLGALISAWPAVAFIGSVEIAMQRVRRARVARACCVRVHDTLDTLSSGDA